MARINLHEDSSGFRKARLDKERGIVHGVKIIGLRSKQGYDYLPKALQEAIPLYEGKKVNVDHPPRDTPGASRSYADRFGKFTRVHFVEGSGLHGDLHYNKKHRLAEQFEYDVENDPTQLGMSHNARGDSKSKNGRVYVESIDLVRSVDLVADPATTSSLFESQGGRMATIRRKKKALVRRRNDASKLKLLKQIFEDDGAPAVDDGSGGGGGGGDTGAGGNDVKSMILGGIDKILDAGGDPVTTAKKCAMLIKKLLQVKVDIDDAMSPPDAAGDVPESRGSKKKRTIADLTEDDPTEEDDDDEDDEIANRLARLERQITIRDMCESMGVRPTTVQTKALMALGTNKELKEMIESLDVSDVKRFRAGSKPRSKGGDQTARKYKDSKEWLESLEDEDNDD